MKQLKYFFTTFFSLQLGFCFAQTANWQNTGPVLFPTNISGQINGIGRVTQLKFHLTDSMKMYATSASGGLWYSNDGAQNWYSTGTDNLPAAQCASVCINYNNDQIIYLGTGDPNYYSNSIGIYKSTDGGISWNPSNAGIGNRMAVEILMDPGNDSILIAACKGGIWKSYDAGANWVQKLIGGSFTDMKSKPGSFDTIYATATAQYFRSVNRGENWTQILLPDVSTGGGRIGISPADPEVVYLTFVGDFSSNTYSPVYKSIDGGTTYTTIKPPGISPNLNGYEASESGQGDYNYDMTVDPENPDVVYVVAHCVWKSTDGGANFTQLTHWWEIVHTDMHQIEFSPFNSSKLFNANDGAIWQSNDGGVSWSDKSNGLAATECYHAAQSQLTNGIVSIGTQDNGELYYGNNKWWTNRGGDWGEKMAFDCSVANRVYYLSGNRRVVTGGDESWNIPFSTTNSGSVQMVFSPLNSEIAFVGQTNIYRTDNLSASPPDWMEIGIFNSPVKCIAISPVDANDVYVVLSGSQIRHSTNALNISPVWTNLATPFVNSISSSLQIVKSNPNILYISCNSRVYRSDDQGQTWTNVSYNLPNVNVLAMYHDNWSTDESIYVGNAKGVWYKSDTMTSWLNFSQNLPSIADIQDFMIYNDGSTDSRLRVAYYGRGVWETPLYQPHPVPSANFYVNETRFCIGNPIVFHDQSSSNTTSWNWSFPGGTPSISTLQNPSVTYNTPGTFNVSLSAINSNGNDVEIKTGFVVISATNIPPFQDGFESGTLPSNGWILKDANNDGIVWTQDNSVGAFGNSSACVKFDNFSSDVAGAHDEIWSPGVSFINDTTVNLHFDVAYARYDANYSDTLAVLISDDCASTFSQVYLKGGSALSTAPDNANAFVPASDEWRTETVNLNQYAGKPDILVSFRNIGRYGNELYIDNVNLKGDLSAIREIESENILEVNPNPGNGVFTLSLRSNRLDKYGISIYNSIGEKIFEGKIQDKNSRIINISNNGSGIYFLAISDKENRVISTKKMIIL